MIFKPELAAKVLACEKTVTRRLMSDNPRSPWWHGECSLKVNRSYAVCPGRGKAAIGRVRVVDVQGGLLGYITEEEAVREGFEDAEDFVEAFAAINGGYDPMEPVWRIEFRLIHPDDYLLWGSGRGSSRDVT